MRPSSSAESDRAEREKIISRVRALLAMTTANGCTEAEAMVAAARASKLMEEHDLTIRDVGTLKEQQARTATGTYARDGHKTRLHPIAQYAAIAIAEFFDCRVWREENSVAFFGLGHDVDLAHDLLRLVQTAADREAAAFLKSGKRDSKHGDYALVSSFLRGMSARVSERLRALKASRSKAVRTSGHELVVIKSELVIAAYAQQFGRPPPSGTSTSPDPLSDFAYAQGYRAGDRVGLGLTELEKPDFDARTPGQRFQAAFD